MMRGAHRRIAAPDVTVAMCKMDMKKKEEEEEEEEEEERCMVALKCCCRHVCVTTMLSEIGKAHQVRALLVQSI